eukprot:g56928.t1
MASAEENKKKWESIFHKQFDSAEDVARRDEVKIRDAEKAKEAEAEKQAEQKQKSDAQALADSIKAMSEAELQAWP